MAADLAWAPAASAPTRIVFMLSGTDAAPGRISFGDGASRTITPDAPVVHTYATEGTYSATVSNEDGGRIATAQPVVRPAIPVEFAPSTVPGEEYTVVATFGGERPAKVQVDFGDGATAREAWATPGGTVSKAVPKAGDYTGTVRDMDARRTATDDYAVTGPVNDPDFTLTEKAGSNPRTTVVLEFTAVDTEAGEITVDWGHPGGVETVASPKVGAKLEHTFVPADSPSGDGVFFVMAYYTSAPDNPTAKTVKVPFSG